MPDTSAKSSSHSTRWRRRKAARPGEIIDAALDVFVARGFVAARLEDVAARAGISKGTVYLYFKDKESLFRALVNEMIVPMLSDAEQHAAQYRGSQRDMITVLVQGWWQGVWNTRLACLPKLMVSEAAHFPELARFYVETVVQRVRRLFAAAIQRGIKQKEFKPCDVDAAVRILMAPLVFAAIWEKSLAAYDSENYDIESYMRTHLAVFFSGLCETS